MNATNRIAPLLREVPSVREGQDLEETIALVHALTDVFRQLSPVLNQLGTWVQREYVAHPEEPRSPYAITDAEVAAHALLSHALSTRHTAASLAVAAEALGRLRGGPQ